MSDNSKSEKSINRKRKVERWMVVSFLLMIYDIIAIHSAYFFALWARHDFIYSTIRPDYIYKFCVFVPVYSFVCVGIFWLFNLYRIIWRFASYNELIRCIEACTITTVGHAVLINLIMGRMPVSYVFWGAILQFILIIGIRFFYRFWLYECSRREGEKSGEGNVMLIGAADTARYAQCKRS